MKPSLLVLYCGGTIGMRQNVRTSALRPEITIEDLLKFSPLLQTEFSLQTKTITMIDSTNIQPHHWMEIAASIAHDYHHYDGFVVIHGTDTMAYTATALSFALGNIGKPVVFTGSQVPPDILGSDAIGNMVNACMAATMDFAEVAIAFGTAILRGNRSIKISESERNAFISPVFPALGSIRLQPELTYDGVRRRHGGKIELMNTFDGSIAVVKIVPGMDPKILDTIIDTDIDGLIVESFGPGNIPNQEQSLLSSIARARRKNIPVLVSTQCIYGTTRMYLYEVGQRALKLGVIPTGDMTPEAAFVKLKWGLGQGMDTEDITRLFGKDIAGEVTIGG
ncbi:MAG: L-asparaginase I [Candidatus Peregrinibacteria bacterium Greene0416_62]|nr:MAG: L-asparaginase I [Candidatus Peregrinibacteria bacterium Greene0416_62]TSC98846.1 MAG: L-asparaginase I [Candidatus Peregrinibacteria bacterium Greene1014_49]